MAITECGGTLNFSVGGVPYMLAGTFKINPGGYTRKGRANIDGSYAFTGAYIPSMWEFELTDGQTVSVPTLQAIQGINCTAELGNGKTALLANAVQEGEINVDVVEGKIPLKLSGPPTTWL